MKLIPNLLSAVRLALAPVLFTLLWQRQYRAALVVCVIAGVTDALDGLSARHFKAASRAGAYLDAFADKILLSGSFVTLLERYLRIVKPSCFGAECCPAALVAVITSV